MKRLAAGLVALLVAAGCGLGGGGSDPEPITAAPVAAAPSDEVTEEPVPEETPPPSKAPVSPKSKPKPKKPKPTKTEDPNNFQMPACATKEGKAVSKAKAKAALTAAAGKTYWPGTAPQLKVPKRL